MLNIFFTWRKRSKNNVAFPIYVLTQPLRCVITIIDRDHIENVCVCVSNVDREGCIFRLSKSNADVLSVKLFATAPYSILWHYLLINYIEPSSGVTVFHYAYRGWSGPALAYVDVLFFVFIRKVLNCICLFSLFALLTLWLPPWLRTSHSPLLFLCQCSLWSKKEKNKCEIG